MNIGHKCLGGGAEIKNSPVTVNIHIHIHNNSESLINKVKRGLYGLIGQRHTAIEGAEYLSKNELQRQLIQRLESR